MNTLKTILRLFLIVLLTFAFVFIFVFFGGSDLFESKNPILIEIGVSVIIGGVLWSVFEVISNMQKDYDSKIADLEKRIEELEHKNK